MKKYVGKFRVVAEYYRDNVKNKMINKGCATYIPCNGGHQIYRYDRNTLIMQCSSVQSCNSRIKVLKENNIQFETVGYSDGGDIYFKEKDFEQILKLKVGKSKFVKPNIKGKGINPHSVKNIPKKYRDNPSLFEG